MNIFNKLILITTTFNIANGVLLQKGIGEPCSNRTFWSKVKLLSKHIRDATTYNNAPISAWNVSVYLQYNITGDRTNSDNMMVSRYKPAMNGLVCIFKSFLFF
jgi:hypothetical protein